MTEVTRVNTDAGRSLAAWLAMVHPEIFNTLLQKAVSKGLGDWTDLPAGIDPVNLNIDVSPALDVGAALSNTSSPSSWLSSIGSDLSSAISSVGGWLTTGGGINSLASVATAYYKNAANQNLAQAQQSVLQTQIARAQSGQAAAPVAYVQNPVTGQLQATYVAPVNSLPPSAIARQTPIVQSGAYAGYPLTNAGLAQLTPNTVLALLKQYWLPLTIGVGALLILPRLLNRS